MAVFSPLTSRRSTNRKAQATQQLIVFRLESEGFALPIRAVQKVIPRGKIYGAPQGGAAGLTLYQDRELLVIDVDYRIFKGTPIEKRANVLARRQNISLSASRTGEDTGTLLTGDAENGEEDTETRGRSDALNFSTSSTEDDTVQRYLLIVQSRAGKIVGLPIDSPPSLQRVPESAFKPLTSDYMAEGNIRCVSALVLLNNDEPPLFLLNPDQLVQSQPSLPPGAK